MAATLGVPTLSYLPYAFVNLLNPVTAIIYGMTNFKITPLAKEEEQEPAPATKSAKHFRRAKRLIWAGTQVGAGRYF